jgi:hypothetical protein
LENSDLGWKNPDSVYKSRLRNTELDALPSLSWSRSLKRPEAASNHIRLESCVKVQVKYSTKAVFPIRRVPDLQ